MSVSFTGGFKLRFRRDRLRSLDSKPVMSCPRLYFPLSSRAGISYIPVVKSGDTVLRGQKIAFTADSWELPLHSSVSGKVEGIEEYTYSEKKTKAIVINNDELYTDAPAADVPDNYVNADKAKLISLLQNSGISELPGGEFLCGDTFISIPPKYLIVNAAESEPCRAASSRRIAENAAEIVEGCKITMHLFGIKQAYIIIESDFREGINAAIGAVRYIDNINVLTVKSKYPQSDPRILIKTVTGHPIPKNKTESGSLITSPEVMYQIYNTVSTGKPVTEIMISIAGNGTPDNCRVSLGTPLSALIPEYSAQWDTIIANSLMTGYELSNGDTSVTDVTPITKDICALIFINRSDDSQKGLLCSTAQRKAEKCIYCGRCAACCPVGLVPFKLNKASINYRPSKAIANGISNCIECGLCSFVCSAGIHLTENIVSMKNTVERLYTMEADHD